MSKTFSLLFYIKQSKMGSDSRVPIYLRITVDGKRSELSTKRSVFPDKWNSSKGCVKGTNEEVKTINAYIDTVRSKVYKHHQQLLIRDKTITARALKNAYLGITSRQHTLLEVFRHHNSRMEKLIGKQYAKSTYTKYKTSLMHTENFIQWKYKVSDVALADVSYRFITEMDYYLRSEKNIENNTVVKYLTHLRRVVRVAVSSEWMDRDPFLNFKMTTKEVDREFLSEEEIELLMSNEFSNQRLEQVRDVFAFCCFTGLAFIDVKKLTSTNVAKGIDGESWIYTKRHKTETRSNIPLLAPALAIVEKYQDHPECEVNGKLLPVLSNQKMNSYLKQIADFCGIKKNLTMHVARHTFATFALTNGVPLETVGKMLGHRSLKTTQHYAKIIDKKVAEDMAVLRERFPVRLSKVG
jgi:site-specific recombinase XerD